MEKNLITIKEAAEILGVSKLTLRNWDRDGKLVAFRHPISNYRVYEKGDIQAIINLIKSGEKPIRDTRRSKPKTRLLSVLHIKD